MGSNIVVVMADQHRADLMGPDITPNIDRLAGDGTTYTRVTCQGPLCMPARASFLTERYVRDHGVYSNWTELDATVWPTYLHALRETGYHTALVGKAHLYRQEEHPASHIDELAPLLQALGFAEVHESGDKFYGKTPNAYIDFLRAEGLVDDYDRHLADHSYQGEGETGRGATKRVPMWDSTPAPVPLDAYIDAWHGAEAARWIEAYDRDAPFFLFVGFPGPHDPWDAPAAAVAHVDPERVPMPASTRRPDIGDANGTYARMLQAFLDLSDTDTMTDDAIRAMRRAYVAALGIIDDGVGRIVDALSATGRLDDTWILYTSDHGEMGGDHGLMSKCVFYEPSMRVPLVVRPPRADPDGGRRVDDSLVEQIDIPATIRAIAGAPPVAGGDGFSLLDPGRPARNVSVSENWGFAAFATDRYKLVVDEDALEPCQLFDLHADPAEDHDLIADPGHRTVVDELLETHVRPFLATPPVRPHPGPFTARR
jgi:choline-sulfatase